MIAYRIVSGAVIARVESGDDSMSFSFYWPLSSVRNSLPLQSFSSLSEQLSRVIDRETRLFANDIEVLIQRHGLGCLPPPPPPLPLLLPPPLPPPSGGDAAEDLSCKVTLLIDECSRLLCASEALQAVDVAKRAVSLARKAMLRRGGGKASEALRASIGECYRLMGMALLAMEKPSKAIACLVLSLKLSPERAETRLALRAAQSIAGMTTTREPEEAAVEDAYMMKSLDDPVRFSCTMCGECCRSADNIIISPLDMFLLSRAPSLHVLEIQTTTSLITHDKFRAAFHFMLKDGYPICYISPAKSQLGHCHFAYPLYTRPGQGAVLSFEDVRNLQPRNKPAEMPDMKPLLSTDYSITDEEEERAERAFRGLQLLDDECAQDGEEGEEDEHEREDVEPSPVLNSYGRPALGCILGPLNMPTMCASYPIAPELSIADFWHTRRSFWVPAAGTALAKNWQAEESFVMVKNNGCEGFLDSPHMGRTPLMSVKQSIVSISPDTPTDETQTVRDFLSGESDVAERWSKNAWFFALIEDLAAFLPATLPEMRLEGIRKRYVRALSTLWYNFDALPFTHRRPIKTFERLQREIESLSWVLARATKTFLADQSGEGDDDGAYADLLNRLGILT